MATNHISIRSYTSQLRSHVHQFHQLVLPLHGTIEISVGYYQGLASVGDCIIIKAGQRHDFKAHQDARFIVVDCEELPENIKKSTLINITIEQQLRSFIQFVEVQLSQTVNDRVESAVFNLFYQLLAQQSLTIIKDKRIEKVISLLNNNLAITHENTTLANIACLSITQFKKVFKASTGLSCQKYLTLRRMEKAKALLTHTDMPIHIVAEHCGYQNPSAFTRKFKQHYGQSPKAYSLS